MLEYHAPTVGASLTDKLVEVENRARRRDLEARPAANKRQCSAERLQVINRARELRRHLAHRYGDAVPDDDAGRDDLALLLVYVMQLNPGMGVVAMATEARAWAPWLSRDAAAAFAEGIAARKPVKLKADAIAERIGCTYAERTLLGFTSIGACDLTRAERNKATRQRRTAAERERRRQNGAVTREQYRANAEALRAEAAALGISYEALRKRRQRAKNAACPKCVAPVSFTACHTPGTPQQASPAFPVTQEPVFSLPTSQRPPPELQRSEASVVEGQQ
jgi:hypothetical protein